MQSFTAELQGVKQKMEVHLSVIDNKKDFCCCFEIKENPLISV